MALAAPAEGLGDRIVGDFYHLLHFEVMVARAERAHFLALAMPRTPRHGIVLGARHLPAFLNAVEVFGAAITLRDGPARAAGEHAIHVDLVERDAPGAAQPRRDRPAGSVTAVDSASAACSKADSRVGQDAANSDISAMCK
jgi:hypothetical protein